MNLKEIHLAQEKELLISAREKSLKQNKDFTLSGDNRSIFLSNLGHEFKTPLNALLSAVNLLKSQNINDEALHLVNIIENSGEQLLNLIDILLDVQNSNFTTTSDETGFSPYSLLEEVTKRFKEQEKAKYLFFKATITDNVPLTVKGDYFGILQILEILLQDIIKRTENGGIEFLMDFRESRDNPSLLEIIINIGGIENSTNRKNNDLVFRYAEKIVKKAGGRILTNYNGSNRHGFKIQIPCKPIDNKERNNIINKVLVVEDNLINQKLTYKILQQHGLSVDVASDGKEAIEKCKNIDYDLVLMDIQMPVMDGIKATKQINRLKKYMGNTKSPLIIALTANADNNSKNKCIEAGMDGFLNKPFRWENLPVFLTNIKTAGR